MQTGGRIDLVQLASKGIQLHVREILRHVHIPINDLQGQFYTTDDPITIKAKKSTSSCNF